MSRAVACLLGCGNGVESTGDCCAACVRAIEARAAKHAARACARPPASDAAPVRVPRAAAVPAIDSAAALERAACVAFANGAARAVVRASDGETVRAGRGRAA